MSFYNQRKPYRNYRGGRRHSDSFSDESMGGRKKYPRKSGGGSGPNRSEYSVDAPLFKEPMSPHRSPQLGRRPADYSRRQEPYFDIRDMPPFVEPEHTGSPWLWDNYTSDCRDWQDKHKLAYYRSRCLALEFENQMLFEQITSLVEENCVLAAERGVTPSMQLPDIPGRSGQTKQDAKSRSTKSPDKSRKDAAAKEKGEKELKKKEEDNKKTEGPKVGMGVKRKAELDDLYGKNSELIQGLETSMQLSFNRNCDVHKPEIWMAVPLNPNNLVAE